MEKISSKSIRHSLGCCGKVGAMEVWVLKKVLWTFSYAYLWQPIASCWRDSQFLLNRGEEPHVLLSQSSWIFARCKRTLSMIEGILCGMILGHNSSWKQFAVYVERGIKNHLNCTKLQMSQKHWPSEENLLNKYIAAGSTEILVASCTRRLVSILASGSSSVLASSSSTHTSSHSVRPCFVFFI